MQQQYKPDFDKIKCLEVVVKKGQMIFIPAFWWNTMKFEDDASVCVFKYKTYMNTVAIIPQLFMRFLQTHNVKRNIISNKVVAQTANAQPIKKEEKIMDVTPPSATINSILIPVPEPVITINISEPKMDDAPRDDATLISDL